MGRQFALDIGPLTNVGKVREINEDNLGTFESMIEIMNLSLKEASRKGRLYAVADGMGGHAAGEVASEQAITTLFGRYYADPNPDLPRSLERAFRAVNAEIYTQAAANFEQSGMGTTLVAVVIRERQLLIANVGDSRAYLVRDQHIEQLTQDHSWVNEQVEAGLLTPEEARHHVYRNIITRSMGNRPDVLVDIFTQTLKPGDIIVLCSDGLSNEIEDEEIREIVSNHEAKTAAQELIDLANERGGPDNITAVVIKVEAGTGELLPLRWVVPLAGLAAGLLLLVAVGFGAGIITSDLISSASPTASAPTSTSSPVPTATLMEVTKIVPAATPRPTDTASPLPRPTSTPGPTVAPGLTSTSPVAAMTPTSRSIPEARLGVPWWPRPEEERR